MVKEYNARAVSQGFSPAQMFATQGDLLARENPSPSICGPDFYGFDLAAVDLAFHHFEDPPLAAKRLVERLKPGRGVLFIVDFLPHEHGHGDGKKTGTHMGAHHDAEEGRAEDPVKAAIHTIAHHGFAKETIEGMLKDAGCVDVEYVVLEEPFRLSDEMQGPERTAFMIRGRREN